MLPAEVVPVIVGAIAGRDLIIEGWGAGCRGWVCPLLLTMEQARVDSMVNTLVNTNTSLRWMHSRVDTGMRVVNTRKNTNRSNMARSRGKHVYRIAEI